MGNGSDWGWRQVVGEKGGGLLGSGCDTRREEGKRTREKRKGEER